MAPVVRLLARLAEWVDQNRALIKEANTLLDARTTARLEGTDPTPWVLPHVVVEVASTLAGIADTGVIADVSQGVDLADDHTTPIPSSDSAMQALLSRFESRGGSGQSGGVATAKPSAGTATLAAIEFLAQMSGRLECLRDHARRRCAALRVEQSSGGSDDLEKALLLAHESYRGMAIAADALAELLSQRADAIIKGSGSTRKHVEFYAQSLAVFQNAALHAVRECQPQSCPVQTEAHTTLRDLVDREALGILIPKYMRLEDHAGPGDVEAAHERMEVLSARAIDDAHGLHDELEARRARRRERAAGTPRAPQRFRTVADALDAARAEFFSDATSPVVITRAAQDSAEESPFLRPDAVFEFFKALDKVARAWAAGLLNQSFREGMRQFGFEERGISQTCASKYRRHYGVHWQGESRLMQYHYTFGARDANTCLSVHWLRDDEESKIVVGRCGNHLPNTLS